MKYVNRGFDKNIILLPGWATDHKIFDKLEINYNYFLPINFNPENFESECLALLKENNLKKISLLGWSLGGNVAAKFAIANPDVIDELILISVKRLYKKEDIERVKDYIKRGKNACIMSFYKQCFCENDTDKYNWFKEHLQRNYFEKFSEEALIKGLEYLFNNPIEIEKLSKLNVSFIHGEKDAIAPIDEFNGMVSNCKNAKINVIKNAGHIPILGSPMIK